MGYKTGPTGRDGFPAQVPADSAIKPNGLSRRSFVGGSALTVGGLLSFGPLLSACGSSSSSGSGSTTEFTIGQVADLTGPDAGSFGIPVNQGLRLAFADVNKAGYIPGLKIKLDTTNDDSITANAVTAFQSFAHSGMPLVMQTGVATVSLAMAPLAQSQHVVYVSITGAGLPPPATDHPGYFFHLGDPKTPQITLGKYLATTAKVKRVGVIIATDDPSFTTVADSTEEGLRQGGVSGYVTTIDILDTDTDFSGVLTNLQKANLDAVFLSMLPTTAANILVQMQSNGGFDDVLKVGHTGWSPQVYQLAGKAAVGAVFVAIWQPDGVPGSLSTKFVDEFKSTYKSEPFPYSAVAYNAGWLVATAIKLVRKDGKDLVSSVIKDYIVPAAASPDFAQHRLIKDFAMAKTTSPSYPGIVVKFAPGGGIVLA
jgi:ABC-type branched-subunit amino acid transport system substrate-binding protein